MSVESTGTRRRPATRHVLYAEPAPEYRDKMERARREIEAHPQTRRTYWEPPMPGYAGRLVVECGCEPDCDEVVIYNLDVPHAVGGAA